MKNLKKQLIEYLTRNGKREDVTYKELYELYPFAGNDLSNKQKGDRVRSVWRKIRKIYQKPLTRSQMIKQPKILIYDLETSPLKSYVWSLWKQNVNPTNGQLQSQKMILSWSAKWLYENEVMNDWMMSEEIVREDDSRVTESLHKLIDEADIVIAHNCVEENTLILKTDFTWVKAKELKQGDEILGFDEGLKPGEPLRENGKWKKFPTRKFKPTKVTNNFVSPQHCYKITFDNGDEITTSKNHYWLGKPEKSNSAKWYKTEDLRVGQRVDRYIKPWTKDTSYEAGWLSGFIDGEGSLDSSQTSIQICQRPTAVWKRALDYCDKLNIKYSHRGKLKTGGLGRQDTYYANLTGGRWNTVKLIGELDLSRFKETWDWNQMGSTAAINKDVCTIVKIEDVGIQNVAVLSTESSTYIAEGYPMHNCKGFDQKVMNTRFLLHDLPPPSHYQVIDTLLHARKQFKLESNKLDYLGQVLGLGKKLSTSFELWEKCMNGDEEAMEYMVKYCDEDVRLLEAVYLKLRPWIKPHPPVNIITNNTKEKTCPTCNLNRIKEYGVYTTYANQYKAYQCLCCRSTFRNRSAIKKDKTNYTISTP